MSSTEAGRVHLVVPCYNEAERLAAIEKCGKDAEITRFKGLGEVNTDEFKVFIGEEMRLTPVDVSHDARVADTLNFYMGKNTPERRDYIMDNLVIDMEAIS